MTDAGSPTTGYRAWQFAQIIAGRLERALRAADLTLAQHNALQQVVWTPGISAADIARRSGITAQSMGAAVNQLVERGLLRREPHPTSRRSMRLFITDEGRSAAVRAASVARHVESETTAPLSPDEKGSIHRLLHHLVEELNPDALDFDNRILNWRWSSAHTTGVARAPTGAFHVIRPLLRQGCVAKYRAMPAIHSLTARSTMGARPSGRISWLQTTREPSPSGSTSMVPRRQRLPRVPDLVDEDRDEPPAVGGAAKGAVVPAGAAGVPRLFDRPPGPSHLARAAPGRGPRVRR